MIDTDKLLAAAADPARCVGGSTFSVAAAVSQFSEAPQGLLLEVGSEESASKTATSQASNDFILCETLEQCGRGFPVSFVLEGDRTVLWRGYVNTSPVQMLCAGGGECPARRKWGSM